MIADSQFEFMNNVAELINTRCVYDMQYPLILPHSPPTHVLCSHFLYCSPNKLVVVVVVAILVETRQAELV